ncbi:hypothetical protein LXL04_003458 [Taraxacum kok-saghyz]
MEDLNSLRIKKQLLLIELNSLEQKISLLETTVTDVPESASLQTKASPQQTAVGKDSKNPLKAGALLKSIIKETTTPLPNGKTSLLVNSNPCTKGISKMTILSPTNKTVQELKPDYRKALDKAAERYYVIYQGPHAGIHTDWGTTEAFCKADKVTCKKFSTETSARLSIALHEEASKTKTPLLRPKIHRAKEDHRDQRFAIPESIQHEDLNQPLEIEEFRHLWNKARAAFYTTDKKTKSLFNFIEGADLKLIYQAFQAGLEIKHFPNSMIEAIKNFRKKVLKAKDDPIYIKVISSIPDWYHDIRFSPYYFLEIGLAKNKKEIQISQVMEGKDLPFLETLHHVRISGLRRISEKILEFLKGSKKRVNYTSSKCIITSWSFSNPNEEDARTVSTFGEKFMQNTLDTSLATRQNFCRHAKQLFEDHNCHHCDDNNSMEGPSIKEDDKSSTNIFNEPEENTSEERQILTYVENEDDYIKKIKKILINFPKLYLQNIEDSLVIETDASDEFWGGVLKAKNSKNEEQICRTKIAGDNKLGRLVCWPEWFSRYTFTVEHLAGNKNVLADCLTRDFSQFPGSDRGKGCFLYPFWERRDDLDVDWIIFCFKNLSSKVLNGFY